MKSGQPDELVILVHGTFAGDKSRQDSGKRWWQRGSASWSALETILPRGVSLPDTQSTLFHWSGANSQSERLSASLDLLSYLFDLERRGQAYHLVGHSHGGSVIWEALVSAQLLSEHRHAHSRVGRGLTRLHKEPRPPLMYFGGRAVDRINQRLIEEWARKQERAWDELIARTGLPGLRSITTIGTPFLHFLPEASTLTSGWRHPSFSLVGKRDSRIRRILQLIANIAVAASLLVMPVSGVWLAILGVGDMLHRTNGSIFFPTMILLATSLFCVFIMGLTSRVDLSAALIERERAWRQTFEKFSDRWLGLWAPADEAISLLQGLAAPSRPDYRRLCLPATKRRPEPMSDQQDALPKVPVRLSAPMSAEVMVPDISNWSFARLMAPGVRFAFNRWISPRVSSWLSNILLRMAQGNDLAGASLVYATPWPLPLPSPPRGLPDYLAERLDGQASEKSAQLAPAVRRVLAQAALDGAPLPQAITSGERPSIDGALLHTSYFDEPDVLKLICLHIERHIAMPVKNDSKESENNHQLRAWLDQNAKAVAARLEEFRASVPD